MKTNKSFIVTILVLSISITMLLILSQRGIPFVAQTNLENMPMEILGFKAVEDSFSDKVYEELNADKHVYRHYRSKDGNQVDLYLGYYGTAKGGRTPHNPYGCLPGSGWGIVTDTRAELKTIKPNEYETVNFITSQKGEIYNIIYHWYQSDGDKVLSTGIAQNIQRFKGRIFRNRNDGAFVRVSALTSSENIDQTKILVKQFSEEILRLLPEYWPVEKEVKPE